MSDIYDYRNYNLGRTIDKDTKDFEKELDKLCSKYDVYCDTESFEKEE